MKLTHGLCASVAGICLVTLPGCVMVVPMRLPTHIKDMSGNSEKVDLTFLRAGSTTREEIMKRLSAIDTHAELSGRFWGRWKISQWGIGGVVAAPPVAGGGGGERMWKTRNLFVDFDGNGIVKSWTLVDDKKLFRKLDSIDNSSKRPLEPVFPIRTTVLLPRAGNYDKANSSTELVFDRESVDLGGRPVSRAALRKLSLASGGSAEPDPNHIWVTIRYVPTTRKSIDRLWFGVDPPTLLALRQYIPHK